MALRRFLLSDPSELWFSNQVILPPGTLGHVWAHWSSQKDAAGIEQGGQGCCSTPCSAQHSPPQRENQPRPSTVCPAEGLTAQATAGWSRLGSPA